MEIPEGELEERLESWPVARLASVDSRGRPHVVPVVFARRADEFWIPVDGKPKRASELVRVANLRARPEAALLLDHYEADWSRLWWIRIDGVADVVEGDDRLDAVADLLCSKYPSYGSGTSVLRDPPTALRVRAERISSWQPGPAASPNR